MNPHGPGMSFSGLIPVEVSVLPVEELRRQLAEHEAARPDLAVDYAGIWLSTFGTPKHKAVCAWGSQHQDLKARLQLAERMADRPSPTVSKPAKPAPEPKKLNFKSLEGMLQSHNETLAQIRAMNTDDPAWGKAVRSLRIKRKRLQRIAREQGLKLELEAPPRKPCPPRRSPFRKVS